MNRDYDTIDEGSSRAVGRDLNPFSHKTTRNFYGGGDVGQAASAAAYVASNIFSWSEARQMPKRQAEANKIVLKQQKEDYDAISDKQRAILNAGLDSFLSSTNAILDGNSFEDAYASVPVAAEYVPVDAGGVQSETVESNLQQAVRSEAYVSYINRLNEKNDLMHCLSLDPRFMVTLDIQSKSIQDLTRGILPIGDAVEVLGDTAEQACLMGRIGNTKRTTARDLGISKLRAQAAGRDEFRKAIAWGTSAVSPNSRQHDIMEVQINPAQRIQIALQQAQLIQQSLQNKNNALAQKSPYKLAELQARMQTLITRLQAKSTEALLVSTHVPSYAGTVVPNLNNTSQLVGSIGQAISAANSSHFFGPPSQSQDGYGGGRTGSATSSPGTVDSQDQGWG